MKIAIVNDVFMIRMLLAKIIHENSEHKVIWDAEDGQIATEKAKQETPDLILMDLLMPVMNGVDATREIMLTSPCAIVVVTASVDQYADMVFSAMSHGALDAISTPTLGSDSNNEGIEPLLHKLRVINNLITVRPSDNKPDQSPVTKINVPNTSFPIICIGASTGGPGALASILSSLPDKIPASIVIIQHVDENFTAGLADWLDSQCKLKIQVAAQGVRAAANQVYIAGGDKHLQLNQKLEFNYTAEPVEYAYRPSIDIFFNSVNQHWPGEVTGVLLTGMGNDGAAGLLALKNNKMLTIAQDEETSAVYGMPRAAARLNAARMILPIDDIPAAIMKSLSHLKTDSISNVQGI